MSKRKECSVCVTIEDGKTPKVGQFVSKARIRYSNKFFRDVSKIATSNLGVHREVQVRLDVENWDSCEGLTAKEFLDKIASHEIYIAIGGKLVTISKQNINSLLSAIFNAGINFPK